MKRVIYIRHAKSSWENHALSDKDRPLNKRGRRDAPFMANVLHEYLQSNNLQIDQILCSSALRTKETIMHFQQNGFQQNKLQFDDQLYHASVNYLIECLYQVDDTIQNVIVCAHNPGLSYLAYEAGHNIDNIPTCGIFEVKFNCEKWVDVSLDIAESGFYFYPKQFQNE